MASLQVPDVHGYLDIHTHIRYLALLRARENVNVNIDYKSINV